MCPLCRPTQPLLASELHTRLTFSTCLRFAAVPRRLLRAHPSRLDGATHHRLRLLTRNSPLYVHR
eukprot:scaffold23479_cov70-Phaeocystis_antarctica.AAC.4